MRRSQGFMAAGVVAVAALVTVPVWAQSGGSGDNESSMNQSPTQSKQQTGQQQQQQPRSSMPQQAANNNDKPMGHKKPMGPHHGHDHHAPPPDGPMAAGNPLRHVCLSKDQAYSPGAVVTMNQKPYACQAMADDTSGTLHWVAVKEDE